MAEIRQSNAASPGLSLLYSRLMYLGGTDHRFSDWRKDFIARIDRLNGTRSKEPVFRIITPGPIGGLLPPNRYERIHNLSALTRAANTGAAIVWLANHTPDAPCPAYNPADIIHAELGRLLGWLDYDHKLKNHIKLGVEPGYTGDDTMLQAAAEDYDLTLFTNLDNMARTAYDDMRKIRDVA